MSTISEEKRFAILRDLDLQGYAVIDDVLSPSECDELAAKFKAWLAEFEDGDFPKNSRSVIHGYGVAHMDPTWRIRLKAKAVFKALYGTDKLLSSMDGVGLLPPPTEPRDFDTGAHWFHCDQSCRKVGWHTFQGAVYLEETTPEDHCLRVLKGSHRQHQAFFRHPKHARAQRKSLAKDHYRLTEPELTWYLDQGCPVTPVGVPRGGMVIWDSRTIHDTKRASLNRGNPDRWRMLTFVSMAPAFWATGRDLALKREAYLHRQTTAHWAAQDVSIMRFMGEGNHGNLTRVCLTSLPSIAKTTEARQLVGLNSYNFENGESNGLPLPVVNDAGGDSQSDACSLVTYFSADKSHATGSTDGGTNDSMPGASGNSMEEKRSKHITKKKLAD